ncbi:hypothetical protein B0H19DRAFT_1256659 [Mycena capillaripes]|nr:hypothetical protein B0H19DRAFT_1256659 [Mycena capillaripes]
MSALQTIPFPTTSMVESSASQKENAPFKQTTLLSALDKGIAKGRKRTITLVNGDEVDLTASLPVTPEAAGDTPPAKRAKTAASASAVASTSTAGPTASSSKSEEKKRKMQVKKIFDSCVFPLKKECKSDSLKFQGSVKSIKFDEVLELAEFETLFGGKGHLVQPTPQNKPKSTVTIIEFNSWSVKNTAAHLQSFFGDELKPLKGNLWSRGGVPTRGYGFFGGGGGGFSKSIKQGTCDVSIRSAEISYSKNNLKCTLKFEVGQVGGGGGYDSDW